MSWSTKASGATKSQALENFEDTMNSKNVAPHCPVKDAIVDTVKDLTRGHPEDLAMNISTYGHLNADGSRNIQLAINC